MTRSRSSADPVELAKRLLEALGQTPAAPANDGEPTPEEAEEIRALAREHAEEMRRARRR